MNSDIEIKVNMNFEVPDRTAEICLSLAKTYCSNRRGDYEMGDIGCKGCALLDGIYCRLKEMPVCSGKDPTSHDFLTFLYNTINPNEMEQYIRMYQAGDIPTNGENK